MSHSDIETLLRELAAEDAIHDAYDEGRKRVLVIRSPHGRWIRVVIRDDAGGIEWKVKR